MSTKIFYLSGPCKWAKVYQPDEFNGQQRYKIDLYLTKKELAALADSGSKVKVKQDDDGKFATFSRKAITEIKGEMKDWGPPMVFGADGKEEFKADIGNGSNVTIKISVYDTAMGKGTRLEAVRVDKWVEYVKSDEKAF